MWCVTLRFAALGALLWLFPACGNNQLGGLVGDSDLSDKSNENASQTVPLVGSNCPMAPALRAAINLAPANYYGPARPFTNWFPTAKAWQTTNPGGSTNSDCQAQIPKDSWGYPTQAPFEAIDCPAAGTQLQIPYTVVAVNYDGFPNQASDPNFVLRWDGDGTIRLNNSATILSCNGMKQQNSCAGSGGVVEFSKPNGGGITLYLERSNVTNPVKNIRIFQQDVATGQDRRGDPVDIFNPRYVGMLRAMRPQFIRNMNWMQTNSSRQLSWASRPRLSHAQWTAGAGGVPLERSIQLANLLETDLWLNVPHHYSDTDIYLMASFIKSNATYKLNSNLNVYVEYSNELWNGLFAQNDYAEAQAAAVTPPLNLSTWVGQRSKRVTEVFQAAFADQADRVRGIAPGWMGQPSYSSRVIQAFPTAYGLAVAPYFGGKVGKSNYTSLHNPDFSICSATPSEILGEASDNIQDPEGNPNHLAGTLEKVIADHAQLLTSYSGVKLVAYEGGQSLIADEALKTTCPHVVQSLIDANALPAMYDAYLKLFDVWDSNGGGVFALFEDMSMPDAYGSWGLLRSYQHLQQGVSRSTTPKYAAVLDSICQ